MNVDELTSEALQEAYKKKVVDIYNIYFGALLTAQGNAQEITEAGKQLTKAVDLAKQALSNAEGLL